MTKVVQLFCIMHIIHVHSSTVHLACSLPTTYNILYTILQNKNGNKHAPYRVGNTTRFLNIHLTDSNSYILGSYAPSVQSIWRHHCT